ncbi:MAG: sialate O-acetylesterase [Bacteroidales bacterium]|jgi:sialate O-acetylesterase
MKKSGCIVLIFFLLPVMGFGKITLPKLISNGMVLQRETRVKIWGWASPDESISMEFIDSTYTAITNDKGIWTIWLAGMKAGGPYDMEIKGENSITLTDILVGDVWICSGQSNMEISMKRVSPLYEEEIKNSENPFIRYFKVPKAFDFNTPRKDISGGQWLAPNPETILKFSAVAYFFAYELYAEYNVPIGLINSSLGGSPAEAWISEEALKKFPHYYKELQQFKDSTLIEKIRSEDRSRINKWYALLNKLDAGYQDPGHPWYGTNLNTADWPVMTIPGYWADGDLGEINGVIWFRKTIKVTPSMTGKKAKLLLGTIIDADSVFVNGTFVGATGYQYPPRRYEIPPDILKAGENTIAIRVISNIGKGGFVEDKPYKLIAGKETIDLTGEWQYQLGAKMEPLKGQVFISWKPAGLFNAMIYPLLNTSFKGMIWYQGESNASRAKEYSSLFQTLVNDWRSHWHQGDFPFLFVQLPNLGPPPEEPSEGDWAYMREAQTKALALPNTAMAVTVDVGEWNDIHPLNKKDVGHRLALAAQKTAYKDNEVVYSGPLYKAMKISGDRVIITFSNTGSGLMAKDGKELKQFAIAGNDKQFVWANAEIKNNTVIVWSEAVKNPVAVRYAWADNPEGANLYNREGLPASPFRTDEW